MKKKKGREKGKMNGEKKRKKQNHKRKAKGKMKNLQNRTITRTNNFQIFSRKRRKALWRRKRLENRLEKS